MQSYYRQPAIFKDQIVFVAEDDLWTFSMSNPIARRLTANLGMIRNPKISPDGKQIAFISTEEGITEVDVIPFSGGEAKRLTWVGSFTNTLGWKTDKIIIASCHESHFGFDYRIYELDPAGGAPLALPYGVANDISFDKKTVVLGRNTSNPARWKRYRGGTAGYLLIDKTGRGKFKKLIDLDGNFASPMCIASRIYFICDHEGVGNIYSCNSDGKDLKKHTNHKDYYARGAYTDGKSIIWHAGADLWMMEVDKNKAHKLEFEYNSPMVQRQRKFVDALKHKEDAFLSKDAASLCMAVRGKVLVGGNWDGSVQQYGLRHGVRYRLPQILPDGKQLMMVSDEPGYERFELHPLRKDFATAEGKIITIDNPDLGRLYDNKIAPHGSLIALQNHKNELLVLNGKTRKFTLIDRDEHSMIFGYNWSPDGRWLAYAKNRDRKTTQIMIWDSEKGEKHIVSEPVLRDANPVFDPEGKYLYLISERTLKPLSDNVQFDFIFPATMKPYLITLQKDLRSPFIKQAEAFEVKPEEPPRDDKSKKAKKEEIKPVVIDFEGICERLIEFPVEIAQIGKLSACKDRIFYLAKSLDKFMKTEKSLDLMCYDLNKREGWVYAKDILDYEISSDGSALLLITKDKYRVVTAKNEAKAELSTGASFSKNDGYINLARFSVEIIPVEEWKQMFREAWRLQAQHFWVEDMAGIDWQKVFDRYYPLVERCACRSDFSDLMWEVQGELGTSHCYEFGGDYRSHPNYTVGKLGIDYRYNSKKKGYEITRILKGDHWDSENRSPLMNPGVQVSEGWIIKAINGDAVSKRITPERLTVNQAGKQVQLSLVSPNGKDEKSISVHTMKHEKSARYRDWVEGNREYVHKASKGKLGYLHIPNMGQEGLIEFHRYYLAEVDHEGLVIDVRHNGGGSVSGLLLQKLARKRIGYDLTRWWGASPYMEDAPMGPMVCLTDELAGSDGDIFSHSFKLLGLGKLIGKRTWGGVIGIWPRHWLVDGTITTQPEFSFWFQDVGWGVENYGTDPDIEVDIMPQDYVAGKDPQLDMGIKTALAEIKNNPPLKPDFSKVPRRTLP
ncbi:MAG: PDZ domain-containing protein [Candidatus Cloacimonetes bacterium]|nr:PDZ domain-containing protein [Candidatus Cloacimonadota bacterium]